MEWKNIYRGLIMGSTEVIPGISSSTVAVILGIYDQLIAAINGIFSKDWRKHLGFLIPLGVGIVLAMFTLARIMSWLFTHYQGPTFYFFLGLIIGILPYLFREAKVKENFRLNHYVILIIGVLLIASMVFTQDQQVELITDRTLSTYLLLFLAGIIGSAAMILPGISGSFLLLVIGVYPTLIHALSEFQFDVIIVTGFGILVGVLMMSKIINYFFNRYETGTYAFIIGMVIGAIIVIFPGWPANTTFFLLSVLAFVIGLFAAYILGRIEY